MIFITGPLYSGKRTFAGKLGGRQIFDVQNLAAQADDLEWLADELAADYDVAAARADTVIEMFCGIPTVLKGDMPC